MPTLRAQINAGTTRFVDMHLSMLPQMVRYGFLGQIDWAVVEAADVTRGGGIVLTTSVGASPTYLHRADKVLIELNSTQSPALLGMHDIFEPEDPPTRRELPIYTVRDRVGSPIVIDSAVQDRRRGLHRPGGRVRRFDKVNPITEKIGAQRCRFPGGRNARRPHSSAVPAAAIGRRQYRQFGAGRAGRNPGIPPFEMYTEVLQDGVIPLLESGRCPFASTCALTLSPEVSRRFMQNLEFFRSRVILRPQEISNHPEIVRRLGIISMNTAIEIDLFGNVNSTHVLGRQMMNGIGGSGDFTRNAYLSIFSCPSTQKGGKISTIVPLVTHVDHSEHSVQIVITEHGIADLRCQDPHERAHLLITNCAHPEYRDQLFAYLDLVKQGHTPSSLSLGYAMHRNFERTGDMRAVNWAEWRLPEPVGA